MKVLGTIVLSIGVVIGSLLFAMLSSCALSRTASWSERGIYGVIAVLDMAAVAGAIVAVGRLNRK